MTSLHPEIVFMGVILRSPADVGTTKNLMITELAKILRAR
jgi:hypothetical protein